GPCRTRSSRRWSKRRSGFFRTRHRSHPRRQRPMPVNARAALLVPRQRCVNIFIAESSTAVGGQELAVLLHAEGLLKRGHQLRLILEPHSPIARMAMEKQLPVTLLTMRKSRYPQAIVSLRALIADHRPAILQVNSSRDSWIGAVTVRLVRPRPRLLRMRHISAPLNRNWMTRLLYRRLFDMVVVTGGDKTKR